MDLRSALAVLRFAQQPGPDSVGLGTRVGDYEILGEPLGQGGTGIVYAARHLQRGGRLALKLARTDVPHVDRIFAEEWHKAQLLNHPHILAAHDRGSLVSRPYLVFRLMHSHLTEALRRERFSKPRGVLELMTKLVGALRFAHSRGILHCDITPQNVLFDAAGEPHLCDFGLARTIDTCGSSGEATGGTVGWMSPEQAEKGAVGVESDVFGLGVLLYWLLAEGRLPFGRGPDFLPRLLTAPPEPLLPPGPHDRTLAADLAAICVKALQKDPSRRYPSATAFEEDLLAAKQGLLPRGAGQSRVRRGLRWIRGRPWFALTAICVAAMTPYVFVVQSNALREVRAAMRPQLRFSAQAQARAVVSELFGMAHRVDAMSRDPEIATLVAHGNIGLPAPKLDAYAQGFDSVNVFASDGTHQARSPIAAKDGRANVAYSDHFQCALRIARERAAAGSAPPALSVCVARAHRSRLDERVKLGIAAPLLVAGRVVGVVEASTMARDRFGALQMSCGPGDCFTALLGPRDRDDPAQTLPETLSVLAQQGVPLGGEVRLPFAISRQICGAIGCNPDPIRPFGESASEPLELEHYLDPLSHARNVAAVAPVARTGLSVLIATPYETTHAQLAGIVEGALRGTWIPVSVAVVAWLVALLTPRARWPWPTSPVRRRGFPIRPE